jgi:hypothetical protein
VTRERLTGRAGLAVFARYVDSIGLASLVSRWFGPMRKSRKGLPVVECFRQLILYFIDGSCLRLSHFDELKGDAGYAATIERRPEDLLSSHAVKRLLGGFSFGRIRLFRALLQELFIWRLRLDKPTLVILDLDTMVMDNHEARKRHGVAPSYKGVKGFQPLQLVWGRVVIDAVLRGGDHHGNGGDTAARMVTRAVDKIRARYSPSVPIIIRHDAGFFDQHLFELYEEKLEIGYISGGRLFDQTKEYVQRCSPEAWQVFVNGDQEWSFVELGDRRGIWKRFRRAIFCRPKYENRQILLEFARPETIIHTNIGMGQAIDEQLSAAGYDCLLTAHGLIECYHDRGQDELVHRALKDFAGERLPFKGFQQNTAFYYLMLVAFFLYETFKVDVSASVIPTTVYPTTFRRRLVDIAGKIVSRSGQMVLKVTQSTLERLKLEDLWLRAASPPPLPQHT